jgi:ABC-2 type transport system permease protein
MSHTINTLIGLKTLCMKEINRILRIWPQSYVPPIISTILYFLIFGNVIGHRIGLLQGVPYIAYIAPGLILMSLIMVSYINTSSSFFGNRFSRNIEDILVSPMPAWSVLWGYVGGGVFRGVTVGSIVFIIALIFIHHSVYSLFLMLITAILCCLIFALAGILNGILARSFDDTMLFANFILSPLIYLGGVFYDIHDLPHVWYMVSMFNPIHWLIALFRHAMIGTPIGTTILIPLGALILTILILYGIVLTLLKKGVGIRS